MKKPLKLALLAALAIGSLLFGLYWGKDQKPKATEISPPKGDSSDYQKQGPPLIIPAKVDEEAKPSSPIDSPNWENVKIGEENYVTIRSIKKFYGFKSMKTSGPKVILEKQNVRVEFLVGQQDVWMNRIKFVFSFPIEEHEERYLVHRIDLVKTLDPVMRPGNIGRDTESSIDTVIIDAGHGGHDPGTVSPHGNGSEKDHALTVAKKLSTQLRKRGFKVGLTRSEDKYLTLQQRVDFANQYPNAVFIGLHFNSGSGGKAHGIETFTLSPKGVADHGRGLKASDFREKPGNNNDSANIALATAVHANVIKQTGRKDRGIRRARYSVITGVKHPAIILEGGFLSNRTEGAYIKQSAYQDRLAFSIAEAVVKYKMATERGHRR